MATTTFKHFRLLRIKLIHLFALVAALLLSACSGAHSYKYKVGVSQCVGGKWREKVNDEMLSAQHLYGNEVKVSIANANNDSRLQARQIDSLVASGVDLIVVAPNDMTIAPAIARARKKGVPVVLFDRKVNSDDYTAYIGGDNVGAGHAMGHYALSLLRERVADHVPRVLELTGGTSSSPAIDRHKGFASAMKGRKDIDYSFVNTDWSTELTRKAMADWLKRHPVPDIVFCHSDLAAGAAYDAAKDMGVAGKIMFLGIDGLPGKGEGIEAVEKGKFAGTYIYPTHGEEIVRLALDILQGKKFRRENIMKSIVVTPDNALVIQQTSMEMLRQSHDLLVLQDLLENYLGLYNTQRVITIVSIAALALLIIIVLLVWRMVVITRRINRREKKINREQTLFYNNARHQLRTPLTLIDGPIRKLADSTSLQGDDRTLVDILKRNVEQLAHIVYDVLNFKPDAVREPTATGMDAVNDAEGDMVSDANVSARLAQTKAVDDDDDTDIDTDSADSLPAILVVDDNADMRTYLRTLLADKYYVVEAPDGESGLKVAQEKVPDLIVSEVMMPVMDGLQFCRKIKDDAMTSHIPVILLTARSTESQQVEGLGCGADAYMTKPFSANLLVARIDNLLKSRAQLRHLFDGNKQQCKAEKTRMASTDREFVNRLMDVINRHMAESNLKMDDIGAEMGISRVQLYRKVKALTNMSPVEFLKRMRLEKAMDMLLQTTNTVSVIAYDTGFSSPAYFSTCFKKQFGKYPTEYREGKANKK